MVGLVGRRGGGGGGTECETQKRHDNIGTVWSVQYFCQHLTMSHFLFNSMNNLTGNGFGTHR